MVNEAVLNSVLEQNAKNSADVSAAIDLLRETLSQDISLSISANTKAFTTLKNQEKKQQDISKASTPALLNPLNAIAGHVLEIKNVLKEAFKPTGLGTADTNVGLAQKKEKEEKEQKEGKEVKEVKADKNGLSTLLTAILGGAFAASILKVLKDKLDETWPGVALTLTKPIAAYSLMPKLIKTLNTRLATTNKNFKPLSSSMSKVNTRLTTVGTKISQLGSTLKNSKLGVFVTKLATNISKFLQPVMESLGKIATSVKKGLTTLLKPLSTLTGASGLGTLFNLVKPLGPIFKKLALPVTLVLEAFEAFKMMFVGSFSKNAEAMAESISEKGVLGRAFYGFTHTFQTIAAAVKTQFDTIMQTFDILFSDHPDGMVGKLLNIGEIILTPIVELFKDFVIYPIQKALSYIGLADDPDDERAAREQELKEVADDQQRLSEAEQQYISDKAKQYGTSEEEFKAYLKYKEDTPGAVKPFESWRDNKVNESTALPTPADLEATISSPPRAGTSVNNTAVNQSITYEVPAFHPSVVFKMGYMPTPQ